MSRPVLPNSPLAEIFCEVRFPGDLGHISGWGAVQKDLRPEYPKLFVPGVAAGNSPWVQPLKISSEDEKTSILVAVNSFCFSTKKYSNYSEFQRNFRLLFDIYRKHCPVSSVTRVGLRYINRLPPEFGRKEEGKQFLLHPCLKLVVQGLDGNASSVQPQFVAEILKEDVKFRLTLVPPQQVVNLETIYLQAPVLQGVHLDLDGYVDRTMQSSEIMSVADRIHGVIEESFFGMITEEYHRYLKGESSAG